MTKKIILIIIVAFLSNSLMAQKSVKVVERFIKSYNTHDTKALNKLVDNDFEGYWENDKIINSKDHLLKEFLIDKALNSFQSIEISQISTDSVVTINSYVNDIFKVLKIKPLIKETIYHLKNGKLIKTIERIPEAYKEYNQERGSLNEFDTWLRENYCINSSQLSQNENAAVFLKRFAEAYANKSSGSELQKILEDYKAFKFKDFVSSSNKLGLQEFFYNAIILLQEKNYDEYLKLYITKDEFIDFFKTYKFNSDYALKEYKENVFLPELEWFKDLSNKHLYGCYMNYRVLENTNLKVTEFSKILNRKIIDGADEYLLCEANIKIEAFGYDHKDGFEIERKKEPRLNFGEIIYIPKKGWRLMERLR